MTSQGSQHVLNRDTWHKQQLEPHVRIHGTRGITYTTTQDVNMKGNYLRTCVISKEKTNLERAYVLKQRAASLVQMSFSVISAETLHNPNSTYT